MHVIRFGHHICLLFCWKLANENLSYPLQMVTTKTFLSYVMCKIFQECLLCVTLRLRALAIKDTNSLSRRCLQLSRIIKRGDSLCGTVASVEMGKG